jgi:hypothetical protein
VSFARSADLGYSCGATRPTANCKFHGYLVRRSTTDATDVMQKNQRSIVSFARSADLGCRRYATNQS